MFRLLLSRSCRFSRFKKQNKISKQEMDENREILAQYIAPNYSKPDRPYTERVYQQILYGRACNIVGLTPDSQQSATFIATVFQTLNPDFVIMGGFNNSKLISQQITKTIQQKRNVRQYDAHTQPTKLYCKSFIVPMLSRILETNHNYFADQSTQTIFSYDHKNKHIHSHNYLTIVNKVIYRDYCKLMFGMPSDYVVFQDIIINQDLQSLKDIFDRVVKATKQCKDQFGQQVKSMKYYPDLIVEQMRFNAVYEPLLRKKQLTYITALLNKAVSICQRAVLFVQNQYVHQISENVHKIKIEPKQVYRGGFTGQIQNFTIDPNSQAGAKANLYLNPENKDKAMDELLEKLVILNYLKNNTLQLQLLNDDQNIFKKMIFGKLFDHLTITQIKQRYINIKKPYQLKIGQIMQLRMKNIIYYEDDQKNYYTLNEMIKTQQQRNIDFPIYLQVQNKNTIKQQKIDVLQVKAEMDKIIKNELTYSQKQIIDSSKQMPTRESLVLYQKILVKAKLRLGKSNLRLPVFHYGAMSAIFKQQMKQVMTEKLMGKKTEKQVLLQNVQKLKEKGLIKQIKSLQQFQRFEKQVSQENRIALDVDQNTGQLVFHEDGNNQKNVQKMVKNSQIFKELFQLTQKHKDKQEYQQIREGDQIIGKSQNKLQIPKSGRKRKIL